MFFHTLYSPNQSLHIERSNLKTSCRLPGILRWSQVQSVSKVHLCPVEVAIDTMQKMNFELQALVVEYSSNEDINLNPLTMRLQGVIDAAVQGGVKKYQQVRDDRVHRHCRTC